MRVFRTFQVSFKDSFISLVFFKQHRITTYFLGLKNKYIRYEFRLVTPMLYFNLGFPLFTERIQFYFQVLFLSMNKIQNSNSKFEINFPKNFK